MVFPVVGGDGKPTGYEIDNSLRFDSASNGDLAQTFSSAGNRRTWTWSAWVKRSELGTRQQLFHQYNALDNNQWVEMRFEAADSLTFSWYSQGVFTTKSLFRDTAAWTHIVLAVDTTDGTSGNRIKLYINGNQIADNTTNFAGGMTIPSQDYDTGMNQDSAHALGHMENNGNFNAGFYITEVHSIDGSQKQATDFGEFDDNGVWIPKEYSGTYGTNGYYLQFQQTGTSANSSGIGADTSGNDRHFTPTNLTATDITTDTCTNNFCTLNPLYKQGSPTFSEGNCKVVLPAGDGTQGVAGGIAPANGKWYWEVKQGSATNSSILVREASDKEDDLSYYQGNFAAYVFNNGNQNITGNTNSTYGPSYTSGDIIMVAMDMDNDRVYFGKNGSWIDGSGNADEANLSDYVPLNGVTNGLGAFANANGGATATAEFNWGNAPFSISSGNSDANGYGNFEYAVPSGYYALCTKNLAEYG